MPSHFVSVAGQNRRGGSITPGFVGGTLQSLYLAEDRLFRCVDDLLWVFLSGLSLLLYCSPVDWKRVRTLEFRVEAL